MNDKSRTAGERYGPAMEITDQKEATQYLYDRMMEAMIHQDIGAEEALNQERANIMYYAGYYDRETQSRVARLFGKGANDE